MKTDIYQQVTDTLIAALEAGTSPFVRGWDDKPGAHGGLPPLPRRATGEHYRGINVLILWGAAIQHGYKADRWFTFNQAKALGAMVRKGEKATPVVFFKKLDITETNPATGEESDKSIPMLRQYFVFNAEQIEGLPARHYLAPAAPATPKDEKERDAISEAAMRSCGADIREGEPKAYYVPSADYVNMPTFARFHTTGGYLRTLAHELCHWTGHKTRLDRQQLNKFGSKDYAFEELVAEIGSAFVGARLGIIGENIDSHASYVASWLQALKNDKRYVFKAAAAAQLAADMVLAKAELPADPEPDGDAESECQAQPEPAPEPVDPNLAAKATQLAQLAAKAPKRAKVQQASTAGLGLFDFHDAPALL